MFTKILRVQIVVVSLIATSPLTKVDAQRVQSVAAECAAGTQMGEVDRSGVSCLPERAVRTRRVTEGGNILFYLGNGRIYVNALNDACAGVTDENLHLNPGRAGRFSAGDQIRIRDRNGEVRALWPPCVLGMFYPISEIEAGAILEPEVQRSITATPVELPDDGEQ